MTTFYFSVVLHAHQFPFCAADIMNMFSSHVQGNCVSVCVLVYPGPQPICAESDGSPGDRTEPY